MNIIIIKTNHIIVDVGFDTKSKTGLKTSPDDAKVHSFWTSGHKCNFDGCDKPEFFPKLVNGWFWSANQVIELRIKTYMFVLKSVGVGLLSIYKQKSCIKSY